MFIKAKFEDAKTQFLVEHCTIKMDIIKYYS